MTEWPSASVILIAGILNVKRFTLLNTSALSTSVVIGLSLAVGSPAFGQVTQSDAPVAATATVSPGPNDTRNTATDNDETVIVVTGSRIARPSYDNDQPTAVINAATLNNRGYTNIAEALNELPGFAVPDSSVIGSQGNGFGVGQSFVNLYDLGSQRTLTLVNGRRFVGANPASIFSQAEGGSQVDLNTIPTKLIDRVDTVSIGGAPIYGSDAIAGTVNIILKKDYEGLDVDAQSGISQRGDLFNWRIRGLAGKNFADGRGNVTLNVEYNHDRGLLGNQREAIRAQRAFISPLDPDSPYQQTLVANTRTFLGVEGGNPYFIDRGTLGPTRSVVDANGNFVRFGPDGNLVTFDTGIATDDPTTFVGGDSLNNANITNLRVNDQRVNATLLLNYEVSDNIRAFGEGWYSHSSATNLAGQPVYNTAFFREAPAGAFDVNGNYIVRLDNPFLTPQAKGIIVQNLVAQGLPASDSDVFYLGRANTDLVSGVQRGSQDLYRVVGGLEGDFQALNHKFTWQAYGNYGRTKTTSKIPSLVEPNLRRALNVTRDANGNIVCAPFNPDQTDPTQPPVPRTDPNTPPFETAYNGTMSTTCAPLNLFGNGAPSQAARDYVTTIARTTAITTQRDFVATVTGALFTLPGGDLGISAGYENRREYSNFSPDAYYTTPFGRTIPILGVKGSYTTNEAFGEFRAPFIGPDQHIPLVRELEVNAAGRYVHNSKAGNAFTWTAGGRWSPIQDVSFRGNYTRSIRAPAVTELFVANQPAFDGGYDPCDQQRLTSGSNPAVRQANCAAAGLPADFASNINSVTEPITVIGNPNLQNEKASSWTAGTVVQPRFLKGFSLAVDYIHIRVNNTIVSSSAQDVLQGCYDSTTYPNNFYCGLVHRDPTPGENFGQVLTLQEPYINQGGIGFDALEFAFSYRTPLPNELGALTLGANFQHTTKGFTIISADTGKQDTRGNLGNSINKGTFDVTLDVGKVTWFNQVLYIGKAVYDATDQPDTRDVEGVKAWAVWNSSLTLNVNERFSLRFNVDNILDRNVPYGSDGSATQNTYAEGLEGRSFLVDAAVHF